MRGLWLSLEKGGGSPFLSLGKKAGRSEFRPGCVLTVTQVMAMPGSGLWSVLKHPSFKASALSSSSSSSLLLLLLLLFCWYFIVLTGKFRSPYLGKAQ